MIGFIFVQWDFQAIQKNYIKNSAIIAINFFVVCKAEFWPSNQGLHNILQWRVYLCDALTFSLTFI